MSNPSAAIEAISSWTENPRALPAIGDRFGNYELTRKIGQGGMGIVYEARHLTLNEKAAIKLIAPLRKRDTRMLRRFRREAEAMFRLNHANIVPILDFGERDDIYYLAMQLVDGTSLDGEDSGSRLTDGGRIKGADFYKRIAKLGADLSDALDHAHGAKVIHRDIKPSNLILDGGGRVWITDFGLARIVNDDKQLTTAEHAGTLGYMAPEQVRGITDERTDIYSLGVTLFELLTQRRFYGVSADERFLASTGELPTLTDIHPDVPKDLAEIITRACAFNPEDRYASAAELRCDLNRFVHGERLDRRRKRSNHLWSFSLVALLAVGAVIGTSKNWEAWKSLLSTKRTSPLDAENTSPALSTVEDLSKRGDRSTGEQESRVNNLDVAENERFVASVSDSEAELSGDDVGLFQIVDKRLQFRIPPDFEDSADSDFNGVYQVTVETALEKIAYSVRVTNANEPPRFSATSARLRENHAAHWNIGRFPVVDNEQLIGNGLLVQVTGGADYHNVITSLTSDNNRFLFPQKLDCTSPFDVNGDNVFELELTATDAAYVGLAGVMEHSELPQGKAVVLGKMEGKRANIQPLLDELPYQDSWIDVATSDGTTFYAFTLVDASICFLEYELLAGTANLTVHVDCGISPKLRAIATHNGEQFYAIQQTDVGTEFVTYVREGDKFRLTNRLPNSVVPANVEAIATCDGRYFMVTVPNEDGTKIYWGGLFEETEDLVLMHPVTRKGQSWRSITQWIEKRGNSNSVTGAFRISIDPE